MKVDQARISETAILVKTKMEVENRFAKIPLLFCLTHQVSVKYINKFKLKVV